MVQKKPDVEYSNVPIEVDREMATPTPRERELAELAVQNKDVKPERYDISNNKGLKAIRVVYDFNGRSVAIPPNQTKRGVLLHPNLVAQLRTAGDLEFQPSQE